MRTTVPVLYVCTTASYFQFGRGMREEGKKSKDPVQKNSSPSSREQMRPRHDEVTRFCERAEINPATRDR